MHQACYVIQMNIPGVPRVFIYFFVCFTLQLSLISVFDLRNYVSAMFYEVLNFDGGAELAFRVYFSLFFIEVNDWKFIT